ncbi:hypothetical protein FSP39_003937, partial [Pinctada imbricata]
IVLLSLLCNMMILILFQAEDGQCIWYGECGTSPTGKLNCLYEGPAKKLTDPTGLHLLQTYCPDLYKGDDNTYTCCDTHQLITIEGNMGLPQQFFTRCPSCYNNFLNLYCYMTCGRNQSNYVTLNTTAPPVINSVNYYVTHQYAYGMYNSCKDVQMPSANTKAISVFCGTTAEKCSPPVWLTYMGQTANGHAPFDIYFHIGYEKNITVNGSVVLPMDYQTTPCDKSYANKSACSCQDCESSCIPVPPLPPPKQPCTVLKIDCWYFSMFIIYLAFALFFLMYVICYSIIKQNSLGVTENSRYEEISSEDENCCESVYSVNGSGRPIKGKKRRAGAVPVNSLPDLTHADLGCLEKLGAHLEKVLQNFFTKWGTFCARHPAVIIFFGLAVAGGLSAGISMFKVTTDPVQLWSAKDSRARLEKHKFDSKFGPFYRTEQLIITRPYNKTIVKHNNPPPSVDYVNYTSLFDKTFLHMVLDLQLAVEGLTAEYNGENVTLKDICFKPLEPDNDNCTIQSILQYWQNDHHNIDKVKMDQFGFYVLADYLDHFHYCVNAPASTSDTTGLNMSCLATSSQPIFPWISMGGFQGKEYQESTALVISIIVENHLDEEKNAKAEAWEKVFVEFMKNFSSPNMTVSFSSERSIEDEINRESDSDVRTIVISYLIMFLYISIMLGSFRDLFDISLVFVDSKIVLGLAGVIIVLLSVSASLGVYSYMGVAATLIIIEVVPFLVLAVGVDNIFILVQTYQREKPLPNETVEEKVGRIVGKVGPSMLLSSSSESIAFFLGALTSMPAVRVFSLYAGLAVLIDFLLQITVFVALMTIDAKRQKDDRFDMCCCIRNDHSKPEQVEGILYTLFKDYYSHFLLKDWIRPIVMLVFVFWFCLSGALVHKIEIGLDQKLSMPDDSYVLDYFKHLSEYLHVGAPVYFVADDGIDFTTPEGQNMVCGGNGCPQDSLQGQVYLASLQPNYTKIAQPSSSWLDDFFDWLAPGGHPPCCRIFESNHSFCPATVPVDTNDTEDKCAQCPRMTPKSQGRPTPQDFIKYLPWYLADNPGTKCAKGGHAAYGSAVNLLNNKTKVGASYFMTYHTILKTNADYIGALREARKIADNITHTIQSKINTNSTVFPYSVFYVYYEQYLTIVHDSIVNISICVAAVFVVTFLLLGCDFFSALMIVLVVFMIIVDILGFMYLWNISLNAVSLVNLVMAIGISVEFCAHIVRAFAVSLLPTKVERAKDALSTMGSSVLSGITLTKLGGIVVLAFSKSQLFQVFYFRMYLAMVLFGATHGLIFLPVLLSYIGPPLNKARLYLYQKVKRTHGDTDTDILVDNDANNPPTYQNVSDANNDDLPRYHDLRT